MSSHSKDRETYSCPTCGAEFNYLSNFKRHSLKHATDSDSQREILGAPLQCDDIISRAFNAADSSERLQIKVHDKATETKIVKADETDIDKTDETDIDKANETDIDKDDGTDTDKAAETDLDKADVMEIGKADETKIDKAVETGLVDNTDETRLDKADVASVDKTAETKINKTAENQTMIQLAKDEENINRIGKGAKLTVDNDDRVVSETRLKPMAKGNYIDLTQENMCSAKDNRITYTQMNPAFSMVCVSAARRSQPYYLMVPVCVQKPQGKQQINKVVKQMRIQNRIISENDMLTYKLVDALSKAPDVITSVDTPITVQDVAMSITSPTLESSIMSALHLPLTEDRNKQVNPTPEIGQNISVGINKQNENLYQQMAEDVPDFTNILSRDLEVHQCDGTETPTCTSPKLHTMAGIQNSTIANANFENNFAEGVMSDQLKYADNGQCFGMKFVETTNLTDFYSIEENGKHFKHYLLQGTDCNKSGTYAESGNSYKCDKNVTFYFEELHETSDDDEVNESIKLAEALASLENLSHEVTPKKFSDSMYIC